MTGHIILVGCDVHGREALRASPDGARHWCEHPTVAGLRDRDHPVVLGTAPAGARQVGR